MTKMFCMISYCGENYAKSESSMILLSRLKKQIPISLTEKLVDNESLGILTVAAEDSS